MASNPAVTVFIPVFNREELVKTTINSVLSQDFTDFELLIIDDGSQDGSMDSVRQFADPRIRLFSNDRNRGQPYTRNRAIQMAQGRYIAYIDSDDRMAPSRLARQVAFMDAHPNVATSGGSVRKVDESGRTIKTLIKPLVPDELKAWLLFRCAHANTSFIGRVDVLRDHPYNEDFVVSQDYDLSQRLSGRWQAANVPHIVSYQLEHAGRISNEKAERAKRAKGIVASRHLASMGVDASADDIDRHHDLTRVRKFGRDRTPEYFEWGIDWIARLRTANAATRFCEPAALDHVLKLVWAHACLQAAPRIGRAKALKLFNAPRFGSGLTASLVDNVRYAIRG